MLSSRLICVVLSFFCMALTVPSFADSSAPEPSSANASLSEPPGELNPAYVDQSDVLISTSAFSFAPFHAGAYVEADVGSVYRDWENFGSNTLFTPSVSTDLKHAEKGFTLGGVLGFQYNQHFSLEMGALTMPKTSATNASLQVANEKSWMLYIASKFSVPLCKTFYWFGKLGYAYTHNQMKNAAGTGDGNVAATLGGEGKSRYMAIVPATGFQFYLTPKLSLVAQWMYLPGYFHTPALNYTVPDAYFYTLGVNYKYLI